MRRSTVASIHVAIDFFFFALIATASHGAECVSTTQDFQNERQGWEKIRHSGEGSVPFT